MINKISSFSIATIRYENGRGDQIAPKSEPGSPLSKLSLEVFPVGRLVETVYNSVVEQV